ncbi:MAG: hypothetical protein NTY03_06700 [Candidatus Bathyarchaeota archaeon]|jgi:hypothetical protein|nr:hypothetical protein [Candidatus Bathyarchaeota archaeon]
MNIIRCQGYGIEGRQKLGKLYFINHVKWTREFITNRSLWEPELARWKKIAEKHGIKTLGGGTPWGNDYTYATIYETSKGMDAWQAFTMEVLASGEKNGWKYVEDFNTSIISE